MSKLPTLVFIPGSWHKPTCYTKITKILQERHGLKCISITLPSTTGNPNATFKDDLDAAREAISNEINHGNNVVVVAHSYGGMVGNSAVKDFTKLPDTGEKSSVSKSSSARTKKKKNRNFPNSNHRSRYWSHPYSFWLYNNRGCLYGSLFGSSTPLLARE